MSFIRAHQLNVMLMIASAVFVVFLFTLYLKFDNVRSKRALLAMELCALVMIVMDRYAYMFRGNNTALGWWMVRISNFLVFLMILAELACFTRYVMAIIRDMDINNGVPKILYWSQFIILAGVILLIISQFTGLYYTFDETNHYQRNTFYPICYIIPLVIFVIVEYSIIRLFKKLNSRLRKTLLMFPLIVFCASILQLFIYGISLNTLSFCIMTIVLFIASLLDLNASIDEARDREIRSLQEQARNRQELFSQTVEALASAIDAKDRYTHGHSTRVAEYSRRLAEMAGKTPGECEEIYFAGILHDVGKIGIPDAIINKSGKLTPEEYDIIKGHPAKGGDILSRITQRPYLSIGARYHHERYDGKGYPEHLKGVDIPEMARIISVADAYDAMSSKRSYRDPVPQQKIREEIIKGTGTQFDPLYAKLMLELIDSDLAYELREKQAVEQLDGRSELICGDYRDDVTNGFRISDHIITIKFNATPLNGSGGKNKFPSIICFDSLNGRVCLKGADAKAIDYYEYGEIRMDGKVKAPGVRNIRIRKLDRDGGPASFRYYIKAVRYNDHMLALIDNGQELYEIIFALPDSSRYLYFALTGENMNISGITSGYNETAVGEDYIPRIAPRITYLDLPDGDIPNVDIYNYRSANSTPVYIDGNITLDFTYRSLPTATRIWHCPLITIFTSDDGRTDGQNYKEYGTIRFDGESWSESNCAENRLTVIKTDDFKGWEEWKAGNRIETGVHTTVHIYHVSEGIALETENGGIRIKNVTEIPASVRIVYVGITGDQCSIASVKVIPDRIR